MENLLRTEDGANVTAEAIAALGQWQPDAEPSTEIQFTPARVVMQDFTGVPVVVDLATMREAVKDLGGDPSKIEPLAPAELVIDHSVIADFFGLPDAETRNVELEYERNRERYQFLRWGQGAFEEFKVVPPGTGIVHQVNIEALARVIMARGDQAYPDTVVGTDSHTTMVNGLGVVGWGVGGIEAEAAMLGQPVSMLIPKVVGFKLTGELPPSATATDLVLTITDMLRQHGVVGKFVEFYGEGVSSVPLANRATIGNMSPEYGSTIAVFPIDDATLDYLRLTGRDEDQIALVEAYAREQGLWLDPSAEPMYSEYLELDLSTIEPSLAGPRRPQDRVLLSDARQDFTRALDDYTDAPEARANVEIAGEHVEIGHGAVTIAAITSCTNTSNPSVMIGAGLLAKNAVERGLTSKPWVKTTLAPGSKVVTDYYEKSGLLPYLEKLGFDIVGYGCTTCIGNSGPLIPEVSAAVNKLADLAVTSVLSGNRNFEGRINPDVKMNYLASPPLVVAYAIAGSMDIDITREPGDVGGWNSLSIWQVSGRVRMRFRRRLTHPSTRRCSPADIEMYSRETTAGRASPHPKGTSSPGTVRAHTSARPLTSTICSVTRSRSQTSRALASWHCWATRSPQTTFHRPVRSRPTARQESTSVSTASNARTSTPTVRGEATTKS